MNPTQFIIRQAIKRDIYAGLTAHTHEKFQTDLSHTKTMFYAIHKEGTTKPWNSEYSPQPNNYVDLNGMHIPLWVDIDFILSQNKFGQFQILSQIAQRAQLPLISVEHTACMPWWNREQVKQLGEMRGFANVFICNWQLESWNWIDRNDTYVIPHCIDSDTFCPDPNKERLPHILTVANDYINRDSVLNYKQYEEVTRDLPTRPIGATPGLSQAAKDANDLVNEYQTSRVFLNTAHLSPIPKSLLEAMSCGLACVSCRKCAIPDYIIDGHNGFLCDTNEQMIDRLKLLLSDDKLAEELGHNARATILAKCKLEDFVDRWNRVLDRVMIGTN